MKLTEIYENIGEVEYNGKKLKELNASEIRDIRNKFNKAMIAEAAIQATKRIHPSLAVTRLDYGVYYVVNELTGYSAHIGASNRAAATAQFQKLEGKA